MNRMASWGLGLLAASGAIVFCAYLCLKGIVQHELLMNDLLGPWKAEFLFALVACHYAATISGASGLVLLVAGLLQEGTSTKIHRDKEGTHAEARKCPFCAETITREAIKCRHCGADFDLEEVTEKYELREEITMGEPQNEGKLCCSTLHEAAKYGNLERARYLLDEGADANKKIRGTSPLDLAIEANHLEMVKLLVSRGARISHNIFFKSHVIRAALLGHKETEEFLENEHLYRRKNRTHY